MARPLRVEYPGAIYYVAGRGNAWADIRLEGEFRMKEMPGTMLGYATASGAVRKWESDV